MKIVPATEVKDHFSNYLDACKEGPIIVTQRDRPVAVLVSVPEGDELERLVLAHTPRIRRLLAAAERRIRRTGGIKHKDFWKAVQAKK
ncbi:MAG: type II toxin-antitoxin system Phd/YefM family antitoxin [Deltaproteobacteria bacterium]|nr:type II toxin-antitoxin system Phd/YefM family antitoxin [Deltaproteobacteria bacterium]